MSNTGRLALVFVLAASLHAGEMAQITDSLAEIREYIEMSGIGETGFHVD